jgi:hypothetical protein
MNFSFESGIVILLFLLVIFYADFGGSSYIPYRPNSLFSKEYPFEGFIDFPSKVYAAEANGTEAPVQDATKGVRSIFGGMGGTYGDFRLIDEVSQMKGSPECVGTSMGYSNSLGGICFTDELKKKLVSRGGNQSYDSPIGQ